MNTNHSTGDTINSCLHIHEQSFNMYQGIDDMLYSSTTSDQTSPSSIFYNLSILKEKVHQLDSYINIITSPIQALHDESTAMNISSATNIVQEIMVSASSIMSGIQQHSMIMNTTTNIQEHQSPVKISGQIDTNNPRIGHCDSSKRKVVTQDYFLISSTSTEAVGDHVIELDAEYLLAKYNYHCEICGKGFKRDANLRMHMRAHGDEYKSLAALANPTKNNIDTDSNDNKSARKFSCPHEGCRWNRKHPKFQPLKSMVCVKNHYKRSHCAKMYVCKKCNVKQFSVLCDLRMHEKHCGEVRWLCSCGTNFSRKDKLMRHCQLFLGHSPVGGHEALQR